MSRRCIVSVAFGKRQDTGRPGEEDIIGTSFPAKIPRFKSSFEMYANETPQLIWENQLPPNSQPHEKYQYAFKVAAIREAYTQGFDHILWADISVIAVNYLRPLWSLLEWQGYWLSDNGIFGEWCSDKALDILKLTRNEALQIREVCGTAFALNMNSPQAQGFLGRLEELSTTDVFTGQATNNNRQVSCDCRVKGHRWDQSAMSAIAYELGMGLQPHYIAWRNTGGYDFYRNRGLFEVHR